MRCDALAASLLGLMLVCDLAWAEHSGSRAIDSLPFQFHQVTAGGFAGGAIGEQFYFAAGGDVSLLAPSDENHAAPILSMVLSGANSLALPQGEARVPKSLSVLVGADPAKWRTQMDVYERIRYRDVYAGVDLVYHGNASRLEYDFVVHPGAAVRSIRLSFPDAGGLRILPNGDLVSDSNGTTLCHRAPDAYQQFGGQRHAVGARFVIAGPTEVEFAVDAYDHTAPLIIDPVLQYATYLGGSGDDRAYGVALDPAGCAYIVGETWSAGFLGGRLASGPGGNRDVFVIKLSSDGTRVIYSTYLGGTSADFVRGIAVDSYGQAFLAGYTQSRDFPVTPGAYRSPAKGLNDAYAVKLSSDGSSFLYSTVLGGSGDDFVSGIALNGAGEAYVAGYTSSYDFPVRSAQQSDNRGGYHDAFVFRLNSTGSDLIFSSYLGGSGSDVAYAITADQAGNAVIAGSTTSPDFPLLNPLFPKSRISLTNSDVFLACLDNSGRLRYSTYLGGSMEDGAKAVAIDSSGAVYIAGYTNSPDFPVTAGALQTTIHGAGTYDGFVVKFAPSIMGIVFSTYIGGSGSDEIRALALDASGGIFAGGTTSSADFPAVNSLQRPLGAGDSFVVELNAAGSSAILSTLLSGSGDDELNGIAVAQGVVVVAGFTLSNNLPATAGAPMKALGGSVDAFAVRIVPDLPSVISVTPASGSGLSATFRVVARHPAGYGQLNLVQLLIPGNGGSNACWVYYSPQSNSFWLMNDTQTGGIGPLVAGAPSSVQNGQCSLSGASSSASGTGTDLTVAIALTFKPVFAGSRTLVLYAQDTAWQGTGWQWLGTWNVVTGQPSVVSVSPSSGSGSMATLRAVYRHPGGFGQLNLVQMLMPGNGGYSACWVYYTPQNNSFYLMNEAQTGGVGPLAPGAASSIENAQCLLNGAASSAVGNGTDLTITLALTFKPAFAGSRYMVLYAQDATWQGTGWQWLGAWTIVVGQPSVVSVSPSSGNGTQATFTSVFKHPGGFGQLNLLQLLIPGNGGSNACWVYYVPQSNSFWLMNESQTGAIGPLISGASSSIENNQCILSGIGSSASGSGTDLTVRMALVFKPVFSGTRTLVLYAQDMLWQGTGWQWLGWWAIPPGIH